MLAAIGYLLYLELHRPCYTHHYGEMDTRGYSHTLDLALHLWVGRSIDVRAAVMAHIKVFVNLLQGLPELLRSASKSGSNSICQLNNSHSWINSQAGTYSCNLEIFEGDMESKPPCVTQIMIKTQQGYVAIRHSFVCCFSSWSSCFIALPPNWTLNWRTESPGKFANDWCFISHQNVQRSRNRHPISNK